MMNPTTTPNRLAEYWWAWLLGPALLLMLVEYLLGVPTDALLMTFGQFAATFLLTGILVTLIVRNAKRPYMWIGSWYLVVLVLAHFDWYAIG